MLVEVVVGVRELEDVEVIPQMVVMSYSATVGISVTLHP